VLLDDFALLVLVVFSVDCPLVVSFSVLMRQPLAASAFNIFPIESQPKTVDLSASY
jgi:hypothetical protein